MRKAKEEHEGKQEYLMTCRQVRVVMVMDVGCNDGHQVDRAGTVRRSLGRLRSKSLLKRSWYLQGNDIQWRHAYASKQTCP